MQIANKYWKCGHSLSHQGNANQSSFWDLSHSSQNGWHQGTHDSKCWWRRAMGGNPTATVDLAWRSSKTNKQTNTTTPTKNKKTCKWHDGSAVALLGYTWRPYVCTWSQTWFRIHVCCSHEMRWALVLSGREGAKGHVHSYSGVVLSVKSDTCREMGKPGRLCAKQCWSHAFFICRT